MATTTIANAVERDHSKPGSSSFSYAIQGWFHGFVRTVQLGRMTQALNTLTDSQLAERGLRRQDIPQHAQRLLAGG